MQRGNRNIEKVDKIPVSVYIIIVKKEYSDVYSEPDEREI
jgi:hypothetical protein